MPDSRCIYFSLRVQELPRTGLHHPIRVPTYRCVLADTLLTRLCLPANSETLATSPEQIGVDGTRQSCYGPDMEPLGPIVCTQSRCQQSCLPAFTAVMTDLGLDPTLP